MKIAQREILYSILIMPNKYVAKMVDYYVFI